MQYTHIPRAHARILPPRPPRARTTQHVPMLAHRSVWASITVRPFPVTRLPRPSPGPRNALPRTETVDGPFSRGRALLARQNLQSLFWTASPAQCLTLHWRGRPRPRRPPSPPPPPPPPPPPLPPPPLFEAPPFETGASSSSSSPLTLCPMSSASSHWTSPSGTICPIAPLDFPLDPLRRLEPFARFAAFARAAGTTAAGSSSSLSSSLISYHCRGR